MSKTQNTLSHLAVETDATWTSSAPRSNADEIPNPTRLPVTSNPQTERLALSVQETAQLLGVCEASVRRLVARGLIRPSRALRHLLIPRTEVERFLRETSAED
ncbi:MAG: helix-turn-helix domain-containing protein [Verrucomicrobiales bacterium]|nr:helix-turn-helix domain-containing protein [Verrucomicrobiales bacterium]